MVIDSVVVQWPSGVMLLLRNVPVDRFMAIHEHGHYVHVPLIP